MTGYYEPEIAGYNEYKEGRYPIYKNPKNHNFNFLHKKSRKDINEGVLKNKRLEIAWVENEIEAFFLQVQGSGRLRFENGEIKKIRYSGSNEQKYTSIGKVLIANGKINKENISMYTIKEWLYKNKKDARNIMEKNKRYIFFEEYEGNIKGSAQVNLIPFISVAVDPNYHEEGSILLIKDLEKNYSMLLVIAHDKGSAIKGINRVDLFTGFGKEAEKAAATLGNKILIWKALPKL